MLTTEIIPDPLDYFRDIFDKVLENDQESKELFKCLIMKHGTKTIFNLTKLLNYPKSKEIYEKAFRVCILSISDQAES